MIIDLTEDKKWGSETNNYLIFNYIFISVNSVTMSQILYPWN